jgi:TonB family protein
VKKSLEATIVIKIKKDGTISLYDIEWEKKSGSRLFDKSVVDAIRNASPVTPPPHDGMEIGIRFYL